MFIKKLLPFMLAVFVLFTGSACKKEKGGKIESEPAELFTYEYDAKYDGICLVSYSGSKTHIRIPEWIEGKPVVGIGSKCFKAGEVTEVYYPDMLKYFEWGGEISSDLQNAATVVISPWRNKNYGGTKIFDKRNYTGQRYRNRCECVS